MGKGIAHWGYDRHEDAYSRGKSDGRSGKGNAELGRWHSDDTVRKSYDAGHRAGSSSKPSYGGSSRSSSSRSRSSGGGNDWGSSGSPSSSATNQVSGIGCLVGLGLFVGLGFLVNNISLGNDPPRNRENYSQNQVHFIPYSSPESPVVTKPIVQETPKKITIDSKVKPFPALEKVISDEEEIDSLDKIEFIHVSPDGTVTVDKKALKLLQNL